MANYNFTGLQTAVQYEVPNKFTETSVSNPNVDLSVMINRSSSGGSPLNISFDGLQTAVSAWLNGRRPAGGMLYPRGIFGK